jgi:hypothetical protein
MNVINRAARAAILLSCTVHCHSTCKPEVPAVPANALSPLSAPLPASYEQVYASSLRNSRVAASARRYVELTSFEMGGMPRPDAFLVTVPTVPHFVLVPPNALHLAVDWGAHFDLRDGNGMFRGSLYGKCPRFDIAVSNDHVFVYGNMIYWNGEGVAGPNLGAGYSPEGSILAMRYEAPERVIVMDISPDLRTASQWGVVVDQIRVMPEYAAGYELVALNGYEGRGVAAISGDLRTVLATWEDRTLRVLAHSSAKDGPADVCAQRELPYVIRLLSIIPPDIVVVTEDPSGTTTVRCLAVDGSERWATPMPFAHGEEPPIDMGGGRVGIVGSGVAAIEAGRIVWSGASSVEVRATAFEDGTLAVTMGRDLRIVGRDGMIRQVLKVEEGETITTPPAIAHDGAVWVATAKALYVAR